jgi:hypothetical protein
MGLPTLTEAEQLNIEINQLLEEGTWENIKYTLSKLGRYKAGGKIFGKSQTDAKAISKITALLDKKGNEMIKSLDTAIKQKNTEFPNNKSQEDFLNTILEIATVYDSIVAASKLKPNDDGYLPVDAANAIIEDLRAYAQKYLDVDLTAAFSVFNEGEGGDWCTPQHVEQDWDWFSDLYKTDVGVRPRMSVDELCVWVNKNYELNGNQVIKRGTLNEVGQSNSPLDVAQDKVSDKFASTKNAIKKGDLEAYGTERMKTLKSWRLPASLLGAGASFGALSWLIHYMFPAEKITTMTPETIKQATEQAFGNIKPGEGMTQIMNRLMGSNLSPNSNPKDVVEVLSKIGGGNAQKGVEIITQQGGIFKDPAAAKETLSAIVSNPNQHGSTLKQVFSGTWAGDGKIAGDTLVTVPGGTLTATIVKAFTRWISRTAVIKSAKAAIAAPILKGLGVLLAAGAVATALARYKGRKSSRAQILNDLVQYIRPVEGNQNNPEVIGSTEGGDKNTNKGVNDKVIYDNLKKYFQDIFNYKTQVNTSTYGVGGTSNADKQYSGSTGVSSKLTKPDDINDILKLLEEDLNLFEALDKLNGLLEVNNSLDRSISSKGANVDTSNKGLNDVGLSSNQLKLFKTHVTRLTQLIKVFKGFNTTDKNLQKLIDQLRTNPIFQNGIDVNTLLSSDAKSLKIFIGNFNKSVYATQFKNGNNIMDQLKKVGINKLAEAAERTQSKSAANAVYNTRREFLANYPNLIKSFYAVFSYLIDLSKNGKLGQNQSTSNQSGSQKNTRNNQTNTQGNQQNSDGSQTNTQGSNNQTGDSSTSRKTNLDFDSEPFYLEEGVELMGVVETHDNLNQIIENVLLEFGENQPEMEQGRVDAITNSDSSRIFTQLANVVPELSAKIVNKYKEIYGQTINRIKLAEFLQTILGSLAALPQQKMVQIINRADMDVTSYRRMLRAIKTPEGNDNQQSQGGTLQFNPSAPEKFTPDTVGNYDLTKINQSARTALTQKAIEVISRQTDTKIDSNNLIEVIRQLIDDINKNGQKKIPTI